MLARHAHAWLACSPGNSRVDDQEYMSGLPLLVYSRAASRKYGQTVSHDARYAWVFHGQVSELVSAILTMAAVGCFIVLTSYKLLNPSHHQGSESDPARHVVLLVQLGSLEGLHKGYHDSPNHCVHSRGT